MIVALFLSVVEIITITTHMDIFTYASVSFEVYHEMEDYPLWPENKGIKFKQLKFVLVERFAQLKQFRSEGRMNFPQLCGVAFLSKHVKLTDILIWIKLEFLSLINHEKDILISTINTILLNLSLLRSLLSNVFGDCSYYNLFDMLVVSPTIELFGFVYDEEWDLEFGEVKILKFLNFPKLKKVITTRNSLDWANIRYFERKVFHTSRRKKIFTKFIKM